MVSATSRMMEDNCSPDQHRPHIYHHSQDRRRRQTTGDRKARVVMRLMMFLRPFSTFRIRSGRELQTGLFLSLLTMPWIGKLTSA